MPYSPDFAASGPPALCERRLLRAPPPDPEPDALAASSLRLARMAEEFRPTCDAFCCGCAVAAADCCFDDERLLRRRLEEERLGCWSCLPWSFASCLRACCFSVWADPSDLTVVERRRRCLR